MVLCWMTMWTPSSRTVTFSQTYSAPTTSVLSRTPSKCCIQNWTRKWASRPTVWCACSRPRNTAIIRLRAYVVPSIHQAAVMIPLWSAPSPSNCYLLTLFSYPFESQKYEACAKNPVDCGLEDSSNTVALNDDGYWKHIKVSPKNQGVCSYKFQSKIVD